VSPSVIVPADEFTVVVVSALVTTCPPLSDPVLLVKSPSALT
jgi:hypothetical protein